MDEDQKQTSLSDRYSEKLKEQIQARQAANDVPSVYSFSVNDKKFVCTLPRSVMAQRRMVYAQTEMLASHTFEAEQAFLAMVAENTTVDGRPLNLNDLDYNEVELLRTVYMDQLLLPLYLGGGRTVTDYMKGVLGEK